MRWIVSTIHDYKLDSIMDSQKRKKKQNSSEFYSWIVTIQPLSRKHAQKNPSAPAVLDRIVGSFNAHLDFNLQLLPDHLTVDEAAPPLQAQWSTLFVSIRVA